MDKSPMEKLDKSESSRIDALKHSKDGADPISCFRSDIVQAVIRAGSQAFVEGFASPILPNTIPFGDRTFVEICPTCTCVKSPNLLLPYLERDLVVPVLDSEYKGYSPHFIDEVLRYPHISAYEFYGIRNIALRNKNRTASDAEIAAIKRSCFKANEKNSVVRESRLDTIVSNLEPYYLEDLPFLLNVLQNLQKKQRKLLDLQMYLSHLVAAFRCSEAFSFTPQVTLDDLSILGWIPQEHKGVHFDLADVRETIMNGLKISYDSSIPLETYLDIVSERKTKIREIVRKIMKEANPQKSTFLSDLERELERINSEVRTLKKSSKAKAIDLFTSFAIQNKGSILAGLITAASMGLAGFGILGCGAGLASTLASKVVSTKTNISIPQEAEVLGGRISTYFEPTYERLLAATLSTDVNAIQVWRLTKRLSKSGK